MECFNQINVLNYMRELKRRRGCVKMLAQLFFMRKAQTFPSPGFVIT